MSREVYMKLITNSRVELIYEKPLSRDLVSVGCSRRLNGGGQTKYLKEKQGRPITARYTRDEVQQLRSGGRTAGR